MILYDNCKSCISECEHSGEDREFVCPGGISCKKTANYKRQEIFADHLCKSIIELSENPDKLENFKCYLEHNFIKWVKSYANSMEGLVYEFETFSKMEM